MLSLKTYILPFFFARPMPVFLQKLARRKNLAHTVIYIMFYMWEMATIQNAMQCFFFFFFTFLYRSIKGFDVLYLGNGGHSKRIFIACFLLRLHISLQKHKRVWCFISGKFQKYSIAIAIFLFTFLYKTSL